MAHFRIELKAWIPFERVVDPEQPARLTMFCGWLTGQDPVGYVTGDTCWYDYTSRYHGDTHTNYAAQTPPFKSSTANHRVCRWCEFDWDGSAITNFKPAAADVDTTSDQDTVYGNSDLYEHKDYQVKTVKHVDDPTTMKTAVAQTETSGDGRDFLLRIHSGLPLIMSPAAVVPFIGAKIMGHFEDGPGARLNIVVSCNKFPSFGFRVQRDGADLYADFDKPINDASGNVVTGVEGALTLFAMLNVPVGPKSIFLTL